MCPRAIIHIDLDAFFVAVERLDNPALIGVCAANLSQPGRQLRLFEQEDQRQAQLAAALDRIRIRFGEHAIQRASLLEEPEELWIGREPGEGERG